MAEVINETDRPYGGFEAPATERILRNGFDGQAFRDKMLALALSLLGDRAIVWATLISGGALWGYVAMHPDVLRLLIASAYSGMIVWPVLWLKSRN